MPHRFTSIAAPAICALMLCMSALCGAQQADSGEGDTSTMPDPLPDLRSDEAALKVQKGDFVFVPVPFSNPTLDTGLAVAGAYFYPQTEQQKSVQPASVTAAAALYTSNKSLGYGIAHQGYWSENRWRFTGVAGHMDLKLALRTPETDGSRSTVNWLVRGDFLDTTMSRRFSGKWYVGGRFRYIDVLQDIATGDPDSEFDTSDQTLAVGLGAVFEYDSRDRPFASSSGHFAKLGALFNSENLGGDATYQSYNANYRSYHSISPEVVLAWEVQGCARSGTPPLWDACRVDLRGFAATDYLGKTSASGQAEGRWQISPRWGGVVFAGVGFSGSSFSDAGANESIPSYGVGARFMVLRSQHINVRVDYARSANSDAIYLSFAEAF